VQVSSGSTIIRNSTFYSNTATNRGGALYNSRTLLVNNSTLSENSANDGAGLYNHSNTTTLQNTIIANSTSGGDCFLNGGAVNVTTNNLIEDGSCSATLTGDPELGPLTDYGGDTLTMAFALTSPALNAGDNATCESTDQRGVDRPIDLVCDIGAHEGVLCPTSLPVIPADDTIMLITAVNLTQLYCPGFDTITMTANSTYTFTTYTDDTDGFNALTSIVAPLTIEGNGSTLVRSSVDEFRFFHVANTGSLVLNDLTMENGDIDDLPIGDRSGGAVAVFGGDLTVSNSSLISNTASGGAAIYGIGISTSITVAHTLVANNVSNNTRGGAFRIDDSGTATIYNSTFDSNTTDGLGGAMYTNGTVIVANSTFNNNSSTHNSSAAGGINTQGAFTSRNNIFANSSGGGDCNRQGGTFTAQGNNLDTDGTCLTAAGGNFITADPLLGPLQNNGGDTETLAVDASSPALNTGDNDYAPADLVDIDNDGDTTELSPYDQRGASFGRIKGAIDLGAYEFDGGCAISVFTVADGDEAALINAIHCANDEVHRPGVDTITLATNGAYTFDGLSTPLVNNKGSNALPAITSEIIIEGNGSIIERDSATTEDFRLLYINSTGDLTLNAVTVRNGLSYDPSSFHDGGAIHNASGKLTINDSTFANNGISSAGCCNGGGGAIWNIGNTAELSISNSSFISNTASWDGGAIYNSGIVTITNSTLSGNSANSSDGGALYNSNGVVTLENVTLVNNTADNNGGGIQASGTITIRNSIIANNAGTDCNGGANFIGEGNNLDSDGTCETRAGSNFNTASPLLEALADNGGQTLTHQPLSGSPVVNAGDNTTCTSNDQRGIARPQGAACDIGAVEVTRPNLLFSKLVMPTAVYYGQSTITYTLILTNDGGSDDGAVVLTDTLPTEVTFDSWIEQPTGATEVNDEITWSGSLSATESITFTFSAILDITSGNAVTNTAAFSGTIQTGTASASVQTSCYPSYIVTNNNDSGAGSLRYALSVICDGGTITFAGSYNIYLDSGLYVGNALTIDGSGFDVTISGDSGNNGSRDVRVFSIGGDAVTLTHLHIVSGTSALGGGLANFGQLTVNDCTFFDNVADGGDYYSVGGGIFNRGQLTVNNSSIINNMAFDWGGGIHNMGLMTITHSLIADNSGGGIYNSPEMIDDNGNSSGADGLVTNSTIANNLGMGVYVQDTLTIHSSTIYSNTDVGLFAEDADSMTLSNSIIGHNVGGDCGGPLTVNSYNLIEDDSCNPALSGDPLLDALGDYGGDTLTLALLAGSPAIDAGGSTDCPAADQRGEGRNDWVCDIGAYELMFSDGDTVSKTVSTEDTVTFGPTLARVYVDDDGGCLTGITVQRVNNNHANATEGIRTGRYWAITPVVSCGNTFTVTLTLPMTATTSTKDKLCRWDTDTTQWDCGILANNSHASSGPNAMPNIVIRQNVTQFSDWAVGNDVGPTAVSLQFLNATPDTNRDVIGLVLLMMLTAVFILSHKRQRGKGM